MKKLSIMATMLMGAMLFTACDADRDDNPVIDLTQAQQPITLNSPIFAGGMYDLEHSDSIQFTCDQPNYGFPATTTYVMQVSLSEDMTSPNELTSTFSKNKMKVPAKEIAIATTKQLMEKQAKKQEDFPIETPVYIRIRAYINGVKGTEAISNIIKLNVKTKFALPDVEVPNPFYVNGAFTGNDWEKAVPTAPVNGVVTSQWRIAWIDDKGIFVSPTMSQANYEDDKITTTYSCSTAGFAIDEATGKITASTPGWYLMLIEGKVDNDKRTMSLTFSFGEAEVWLIGTSIINADAGITSDNCWNEATLRSDFTKYVKFETPTTMNGEFVSPELTSPVDGDGGSRCYVKVKNYDW